MSGDKTLVEMRLVTDSADDGGEGWACLCVCVEDGKRRWRDF